MSRSVSEQSNYVDFFTYKAKAQKLFDENKIDAHIDKKYEGFSNYYKQEITYKGETFPSNEHAFHWEKFQEGTSSKWYRDTIRNAATPNESKELGGQRASRFTKSPIREAIKRSKIEGIKLRDGWESIKDQIMYDINKAKYTQNTKLKNLLLSTGSKIIREASPYDSYWGIGPDGKGQNRLGIILMKIRNELH